MTAAKPPQGAQDEPGLTGGPQAPGRPPGPRQARRHGHAEPLAAVQIGNHT